MCGKERHTQRKIDPSGPTSATAFVFEQSESRKNNENAIELHIERRDRWTMCQRGGRKGERIDVVLGANAICGIVNMSDN